MIFNCLFGHASADATFNRGIFFSACDRCGRELIKAPGGRWYPVPKKYVVIRKVAGTHAISSKDLLRKSRKRAPLLHRLRPRRRDAYDAYFY